MNFLELLILAFTLGIDGFISLLVLSSVCKYSEKKYFYVIFSVAFFHFVMTLVGAIVSKALVDYISEYAHYLSAAVFSFIGIKMMKEAFVNDSPSFKFSFSGVILFSYLLSVDALATGFSLALLGENRAIYSALIIAVGALVMSYAGHLLGKKCSTWNTKWTHMIAGLIMLILGIRIIFGN